MIKQSPLCVELSESSDEDYVELESAVQQTKYKHKGSSGTFEILELQDTSSLLIQTSRGGIIATKQQYNLKTFSQKDWRQYFQLGDTINIILHSNAAHSIIVGLDNPSRCIFWNSMCPPNTAGHLNKHPGLDPQKYQEAIKTSLAKLEKRYFSIGYSLAELKERNQYVSEMLKEYAMKDPEVGYERGMEYVAFAIVDCALSGESTRYEMIQNLGVYMRYIMRNLQFRGLYLPSKPSVFTKTKRLEERIKSNLPDLYKKLNDINTQLHKLFFKYYLSLFLHGNCHRVLVTRIIQLLLLQGSDFVTDLIIQILTSLNKQILSLPISKLQPFLMNNLFRSYFQGTNPQNALYKLEQLIIRRSDAA